MRSREEAEGDTRMMGLGRREEDEAEDVPEGVAVGSNGFFGMLPGPGVGVGLPPFDNAAARLLLRPRNSSAVLRICEKSW